MLEALFTCTFICYEIQTIYPGVFKCDDEGDDVTNDEDDIRNWLNHRVLRYIWFLG